ncbi:hypothetical protein QFC22_000301 [Naganishia vaughanmartiniae]|uniref:Uncharacterized protein n=1 Tax=Naganishia vaughanmartiniae TaxID=1424756 RepID=A0ACC2XPQ3_9TREE|nr:hypothetical protein QFC22_000301 [Naganishia vaughanmartiniae]
MHLLFRNILLEERQDIRKPTIQAWNDALRLAKKSTSGKIWFEPFIQEWFNLALIPTIDGYPTGAFAAAEIGIRRATELHNVDKGVMSSDFSLVDEDMVFHNRVDAIVALAKIAEIGDANITLANLVSSFLMSTSSHQLTLCGIFMQEWAQVVEQYAETPCSFMDILPEASRIVTALAELTERGTPEAYYEVAKDLTSIKQETTAIRLALENAKKASDTSSSSLENGETSLADVKNFLGTTFDTLMQTSLRRSPLRQQLVDRKNGLATAVLQFERSRVEMDNRVATSAAAALIWMRVTPPRLNPIIQNVMKGIKNESNPNMQKRAANAIAVFIENCLDPKTSLPSTPVSKIVDNLASFICQDSVRTPSFTVSRAISGVYALQEERKLVESKKTMADTAQYAGVTFDEKANTACACDGAERALEAIARLFGDSLFEKVPRLLEIISSAVSGTNAQNWGGLSTEAGQAIIDCLTVLQVLLPNVSLGLHTQLSALLLPLLDVLRAPQSILRNVAAKTLAVMCEIMPSFGMLFVIEKLLPLFGDAVNEVNRSGAMEAIHYLVQRLQIKVLPYILFLIIPVLGRMSDGSNDIRLLATSVFATLIKLMPLEEGIPDAEELPPRLLAHRDKEREFLKQLMNNRKVDPYVIPVNIKAELRPYQRDGVSWLAFLAKYQLHGILCDDMGLGKSLQTICIIASKHHERRLLVDSTGSSNAQPIPSLIICPPTLIGHWYHEILKFAENLKPFKYFGTSKDRENLRDQITRHDIVITSYEVIRADIDALKRIPFLYCVLDEGHIIKNGKSKLSIAIKTLQSNHRVILSGTPIQNNVLELWNLFDFLMPGFLGSEKQFNDKFSKPILTNREGKASAKQSEAATLALDALHKQVLPFLLRRLKEDVLDDLPPKIIQDYYCELSSVQKLLYDEFHVSRAAKEIQEVLVQDTDAPRKEDTDEPEPQRHVFQTLQFLRKLCNHPLLAVNQDVAIYRQKVQEAWLKDKEHTPKDPFDLAHCPKLVALQQLLLDCGIGHGTDVAGETSAIDATANHRVLIFAQTKQMLDIIQKDLFAKVMPSVSFMRLDGSTEPLSRHDIVQTFNNDPSIDVLLLTTSVGGLGLTLTGADTVIFMDHDWNPMKDAQAMDRAHRIGQKKVVNVYRLITRGTLEEKIMSLQKFKLNIANSVVNEQNSGLDTMNTDQLLDLFDVDTGESANQDQPSHAGAHSAKPRALEGLSNLPAEDEYESLSLDNFLSKF